MMGGYFVSWVLLYMGGSIVSWVFDGGFLLNLGFYCIMEDYFVSWVLDRGFYFILGLILFWGLLCILGVCWGVSIVS
jgi:hypothetical protein